MVSRLKGRGIRPTLPKEERKDIPSTTGVNGGFSPLALSNSGAVISNTGAPLVFAVKSTNTRLFLRLSFSSFSVNTSPYIIFSEFSSRLLLLWAAAKIAGTGLRTGTRRPVLLRLPGTLFSLDAIELEVKTETRLLVVDESTLGLAEVFIEPFAGRRGESGPGVGESVLGEAAALVPALKLGVFLAPSVDTLM